MAFHVSLMGRIFQGRVPLRRHRYHHGFMLSTAAQASTAGWLRQACYRLGFRAQPWPQAVPVARVVGWTSQASEELRFRAHSESGTLEPCLEANGDWY